MLARASVAMEFKKTPESELSSGRFLINGDARWVHAHGHDRFLRIRPL